MEGGVMIQNGESTAIVVDRSWAYRKMIRIYLGPNDGGESSAEGSGDSHLVIADVLQLRRTAPFLSQSNRRSMLWNVARPQLGKVTHGHPGLARCSGWSPGRGRFY